MVTSPPPSRGARSHEESKWKHHLYLYGLLVKKKNQSGDITPTFSGCSKGEEAKWLHHRCLLEVPEVEKN